MLTVQEQQLLIALVAIADGDILTQLWHGTPPCNQRYPRGLAFSSLHGTGSEFNKLSMCHAQGELQMGRRLCPFKRACQNTHSSGADLLCAHQRQSSGWRLQSHGCRSPAPAQCPPEQLPRPAGWGLGMSARATWPTEAVIVKWEVTQTFKHKVHAALRIRGERPLLWQAHFEWCLWKKKPYQVLPED